MSKNLFEIRDELAEKVKEIQLSRVESSEGWDTLKYLQEVDYSIRLIVNNIGGRSMKDRSCLHCKWKGSKETLVGKIHWCRAKSKETQLNDYCINFIEKK